MSLTTLLVFAGALFIAAGSPGPSVAALVARVLTKGSDVLPFLAAIRIGEAVWLTCAVADWRRLLRHSIGRSSPIKWAGVAYLVSICPGKCGIRRCRYDGGKATGCAIAAPPLLRRPDGDDGQSQDHDASTWRCCRRSLIFMPLPGRLDRAGGDDVRRAGGHQI